MLCLSPYVAGVAWHCYVGRVAAQTAGHDAYPDKLAILSECSGGDWEPVRSGGMLWLARNLILDAVRNWASGVVLWNLALDQNHGPHRGGCGTRSEEHTSELQSLMRISYAVFCWKKKINT